MPLVQGRVPVTVLVLVLELVPGWVWVPVPGWVWLLVQVLGLESVLERALHSHSESNRL